ncbi:MAG TPA: hypothetical protein VFQ53_21070 [Kofleriaceae bacterium]|nr:hypothetical protein [Kofleriaceae bacterium]
MDVGALPAALTLAVALVACDAAPDPTPHEVVEVASVPATPSRALDLVLQVDNSGSTVHLQFALAEALPALLDAIAIDGELPDLHIAVVSSDLGTTGSLDPSQPAPDIGMVGQGGCAGAGDDGGFVTNGAPITGTFVVDESDGAGGRTTNYTGTLADAVRQMVSVGSVGCGFEQPLAATRRALERADQASFVRPDASLAVLVLADEDDCSVRDPQFFTADTSTLGDLQSFRCTRFGITCAEPLDALGIKTACAPDEASSYVDGIQRFADFFAGLKRHDQLVIAAIAGVPDPFEIIEHTINGMPQLGLAHSCMWQDTTTTHFADPGVRLAALAERLASRGAFEPVCTFDLRPALRAIALPIRRSLGIACIDTASLADTSPEPGIQPACEAYDVSPQGIATPLPRCPADGDCFELVTDPAACPTTDDHARIAITRTAPPPPGTRVDVRCER